MEVSVYSSVVAVCISELKGTVKTPVSEIYVKTNHGIVGDAHAGEPFRQVSLLAVESVEKLRGLRDEMPGFDTGDIAEKSGIEAGAFAEMPDFEAGAFAENILTSGICLHELPIGTCLRVGSALFEVTQIGKDCHNDGCAIKQQTGDCVMPREGIFAKVLEDGTIKPGDMVVVISS